MVIKEIPEVSKGGAIPWFDKHGGGTQYMTDKDAYKLVTDGFLEEIK